MEKFESMRELMRQTLRLRMAFRQGLQSILRQHNLDMTFEMLQIMNCLWSEQGVSQQMLAEKTTKDKACLTGLMASLEKRGLVVRREDPSDKRNRLVFLTPEGEALNGYVKPLVDELYSSMADAVGIDSVGQCVNELKRMNETLAKL